MRALLVGLVFVFFAVLGPACLGSTCKNPKRDHPNGESARPEGVLVQCNVVIICPGGTESRFDGMTDPQITDTGSNLQNQINCEELGKRRNPHQMCKGIRVSPQIICLDPPGSGCNAGTGDGSTVIIVGNAASGDYRSDPLGAGGSNGQGGDGSGGQAGH